MDGHQTGDPGLRAVLVVRARDHQLAERLRIGDAVVPPQPRGFTVASPGESLDRVQDPPLGWNDRIGHEPHQLVALVQRGGAPGRILVDVLGQHALGHDDRACLDHLVDHRRAEHPPQQAVDVAHGARRDLRGPHPLPQTPLAHVRLLQIEDQVPDVPRADRAHRQVADPREHVVPQPAGLVGDGLDVT